MILVCPSCDAKFKIPDGAIPAEGRTVRCANCKNSWHAASMDIMRKPAAPVRVASAPAQPAAKPEPTPVAFDGKLGEQAARDAAELRRSVRGTLGPEETIATPRPNDPFGEKEGEDDVAAVDFDEAGPDDDSEDFGVSAALRKSMGDDFDSEFGDDQAFDDEDEDEDEDYDEDDFLARRRADQRRQNERISVGRRRQIFTIGLGGLILFWLAVFYVFIFEQENMRHYFPNASEFVYSSFGGLDDRDRFRPEEGETLTKSPAEAEVYVRAYLVETTVETRRGQQGLVLRGYVENSGVTGAYVPKVRATILDVNGKELESWIIDPPGLMLRKGRIDEKSGKTITGGVRKFEDFHAPIPAGADKTAVKVLDGTKSTPKAEVG